MKDPIQHFPRNKSGQTNERCNKHGKQSIVYYMPSIVSSLTSGFSWEIAVVRVHCAETDSG